MANWGEPLPSWGSPALKTALNRYGKDVLKKAALRDHHPRFICKGRINGQDEFLMDVRGAQQHERERIEGFLRQMLGDGQNRNVPVVVFGRDGQRQDFQLRRDDSRYVFRGNRIGAIINSNQNIDGDGIELWGYPDDGIPVFVLTVGVITR